MDATTGVFKAVVAAASRRATNRVPGGSSHVSSKGESTAGRVSRAAPTESDERKNTMEDFPEVGASGGFSDGMGTVPAGAYLPETSPPAARGSPYRYVGVLVPLSSRYAANGSDPASEEERSTNRTANEQRQRARAVFCQFLPPSQSPLLHVVQELAYSLPQARLNRP